MKKLLSVFLAVIIVATLAIFASCDMSDWSLGQSSSSGNETVETSSDTEPTKPIEEPIEEEFEEIIAENFEFKYLSNAVEAGWFTEEHLLCISYYIYGSAKKKMYDEYDDNNPYEYRGIYTEDVKFTPKRQFVELSKKQEAAILNAYYGLRKNYFAKGQGVETLSVAKNCSMLNGIYVLSINDPTLVTSKRTYTYNDLLLGDDTYFAVKPISENASKSTDFEEKPATNDYEVCDLLTAYERGLITEESVKNFGYYYYAGLYLKSDPEVTGAAALPVKYAPTETLVPISKKEYDAINVACNSLGVRLDVDSRTGSGFLGAFGGGYMVKRDVPGMWFEDMCYFNVGDVNFVSNIPVFEIYFVKPIYDKTYQPSGYEPVEYEVTDIAEAFKNGWIDQEVLKHVSYYMYGECYMKNPVQANDQPMTIPLKDWWPTYGRGIITRNQKIDLCNGYLNWVNTPDMNEISKSTLDTIYGFTYYGCYNGYYIFALDDSKWGAMPFDIVFIDDVDIGYYIIFVARAVEK